MTHGCPSRLPNEPRISCGDCSTAHNPTFLRPEAPASCVRWLGSPRGLALRLQQVLPDFFKRVEERIWLERDCLSKHDFHRIPGRILSWSKFELPLFQ